MTITDVHASGSSTYDVTFSANITFVAGTPDGNFLIAGVVCTAATSLAANKIQYTHVTPNPGNPWALNGQPNNTSTPISFPESGTTT